MSEILAISGAKTFRAALREELEEGGGGEGHREANLSSVCLSVSLLPWEVDGGLVLLGRQVGGKEASVAGRPGHTASYLCPQPWGCRCSYAQR